jgi:hypothetical protein
LSSDTDDCLLTAREVKQKQIFEGDLEQVQGKIETNMRTSSEKSAEIEELEVCLSFHPCSPFVLIHMCFFPLRRKKLVVVWPTWIKTKKDWLKPNRTGKLSTNWPRRLLQTLTRRTRNARFVSLSFLARHVL